jgi:annexin A7/11
MPLNDASEPADMLRKAMKGFGTDDGALIRTLCHYPGPLIPHLKATYQQRHSRSLENDIKSETSGHFETSLLAILRGPLDEDVHLLHKALKGAGTDEELLNDVLIARSNADLNAIKRRYHETHHRTLESDVASDLSAKTGRLFSMILAATRQEESSPIIGQNVEQDASELQRATEGQLGADQLTVCSILANRSNGQIRAIAQAYHARFRLPLEDVIKKEFSGHMETALLQMIRAATDPVMRDAILLEDCMAGPGTKDNRLIAIVVRIHWDRGHAGQVGRAYRQKFGKDLVKRIQGETSGSYEKVLVAMVG